MCLHIAGLENFPARDLVDDLRPVLEYDTYTAPCLDNTTSSDMEYRCFQRGDESCNHLPNVDDRFLELGLTPRRVR